MSRGNAKVVSGDDGVDNGTASTGGRAIGLTMVVEEQNRLCGRK